jgi:hypothetical protein
MPAITRRHGPQPRLSGGSRRIFCCKCVGIGNRDAVIEWRSAATVPGAPARATVGMRVAS